MSVLAKRLRKKVCAEGIIGGNYLALPPASKDHLANTEEDRISDRERSVEKRIAQWETFLSQPCNHPESQYLKTPHVPVIQSQSFTEGIN